ncbi:hypothetical protein Ahy_B09g094750 [Arachis hypogaea]|uniref:NPH3 domain-containing protein n=1 Tax=Arachis hypogaea TaxID=3818 RepID=A0A444XCD4_ARAHY|nr:hypothetical protein Ahy_B09g094750 [Arachis hypogaea]
MLMTATKAKDCTTSTLLELFTEMKNQTNTDSINFPPPRSPSSQFSSECWFDDACILDMDYFVKTLSGIKAKGVRADLIGSIITHYASKWLPDLSAGDLAEKGLTQFEESPESVTASWMKKRFFVETLVGVLPPEKDAIPCNFLLRLLRTANMVGVEASYRHELERRISWQLDQASLRELVIPSFSHTCGTLLDVELVIRLAHPSVSKEDRKGLCRLIDSRKLTPEASLHAAQNERFPVRAVIQVLLSEQTKLNRNLDWSGSLISSTRSPNGVLDACLSKREMNAQHMEIRKLKEELYRVQSQCNAMQVQMERMVEKKKGFFKWMRFGVMPNAFGSKGFGGVEKIDEVVEGEVGFGRQTPMDMKTKLVKGRTPHKWRKSLS